MPRNLRNTTQLSKRLVLKWSFTATLDLLTSLPEDYLSAKERSVAWVIGVNHNGNVSWRIKKRVVKNAVTSPANYLIGDCLQHWKGLERNRFLGYQSLVTPLAFIFLFEGSSRAQNQNKILILVFWNVVVQIYVKIIFLHSSSVLRCKCYSIF